MEISHDEIDAYPTKGGRNWYASKGIGSKGQTVHINYIADSLEEIAALAHGLGIAHNVTMHEEAEYIAPAEQYEWLDRKE